MPNRISSRPLFVFCFILLWSFAGAQTVVQNLADSGVGSLREAITNAADGEVITFDASLSGGRLQLTSGELITEKRFTIDGSSLAQAIKLDPAGASRILTVRTQGDVSLLSLELVNGSDRDGGAIQVRGTLTLTDCTLHHNTANDNSSSEGLGGAIYSSGDISLTNCIITENTADGNGGAIHMFSGTATLTHCTITRNSLPHATSFSFTRLSGKIAGLGVGPARQSPNLGQHYRLHNTIVCGNIGTGERSSHPNQDISPQSIIEVTGSSNLIGENAYLSPLGDYGGRIPTIMPMSISPAIDRGVASSETTDVRGAARQTGSAPDLGAVETGSLPDFDISVITNPIVTLTTDRADYVGNPVGLSLREAIVRATLGATVTFAPELSGEQIDLSHGQLNLERDLTIDGTALPERVAISGADQSRVFHARDSSNISLRFLTICNGFAEATLVRRRPHGGHGAGILNDGSLSLFRCLLNNNNAVSGGGVASRFDGICEIDQCRFEANNVQSHGGGAHLLGQFSVKNSLFFNNIAGLGEIGGTGGGLYLSGSNPHGAEVSHSTFVANSATTGGGVAASQQTLAHCTLSQNSADSSGGIYWRAIDFRLRSSIVSGNTATTDPDLKALAEFQSTNNLIGGEPLLGPLQDNGGSTFTLLPLPSSPAIDPDLGSVSDPHMRDQRGYFRTVGTASDIGAVEVGSMPFPQMLLAPIVTNQQDIFRQLSNPDLADLTLREAIAYSAPGATVTLSSSLPASGLKITQGEINIPHPLSIEGASPAAPNQLDAFSQSRFFHVPSGRSLTLKNLHLKNGRMARLGDEETLYFDNEIIEQELLGGAIFAEGSLMIDHCTFSGCQSNYHGGAIACLGNLNISNSTFTRCSTALKGGAVWAFSTSSEITITLSNTAFEANRCGFSEFPDGEVEGGALSIRLPASTLSIESCYFLGNQAVAGGAISCAVLDTQISGSSFAENTASNAYAIERRTVSPGGVRIDVMTLKNSTFYANRGFPTGPGDSMITGGSPELQFIHCTLVDLGGGKMPSTSATFTNCILSSSAPLSDADLSPGSSGNYVGAAAQLSPFGDYGGAWPTVVPLPGSPSLDLGSATELVTDQRGLPRIAGAQADAGAVERQGTPDEQSSITNPVVTRADDPSVWDRDPQNLSLRQAILLANTGSKITFHSDLDREKISLRKSTINIDDEIEIDASALSTPVEVGSSVEFTLFEIRPSASLTLRHLSFMGQTFSSQNVAILALGTLGLDHCQFIGNSTFIAPLRVEGEITASNCHFEGNQSERGTGVALLFPGASGTFSHCSFIKNTTNFWGGALGAISSPDTATQLTLESSTFHGNSAGISGGAIFTSIPTVIDQCTISGNEARAEGGGIISQGTTLSLSNSVVALNQSPDSQQLVGEQVDAASPSNFLSGDPFLSPPGYYGGFTQTMLPLPNSPLIDAGVASGFATDQRGQPRNVGAAVDIGAVEFQGARPELLLTFHLDTDQDGVSNGLEIATGRDPFFAGDSSALALQILPDGQISTGFDPSSADTIIFKITRSLDLENFDTLILSNESTPLTSIDGILNFTEAVPLQEAYYRIEVSPR